MISVAPKMLLPTMCQASPNSVAKAVRIPSAQIAKTIPTPWVMLFASSSRGLYWGMGICIGIYFRSFSTRENGIAASNGRFYHPVLKNESKIIDPNRTCRSSGFQVLFKPHHPVNHPVGGDLHDSVRHGGYELVIAGGQQHLRKGDEPVVQGGERFEVQVVGPLVP